MKSISIPRVLILMVLLAIPAASVTSAWYLIRTAAIDSVQIKAVMPSATQFNTQKGN